MISSYYYRDAEAEAWEFEESSFDRINLLVGASGSGKTRFLNTLFNIANTVVQGTPFRIGQWRLSVSTEAYEYQWEYEGTGDISIATKPRELRINRDIVKRKQIKGNADYEMVVDRRSEDFIFSGSKLPKLQKDRLSITLLKEEEAISPLYDVFAKVQRRSFHAEGLLDAQAIIALSPEVIQKATAEGLEGLWKGEYPLNAKLFFLKNSFPSLYELAVETFRGVFTTITDCDVQEMKNPRVRIDTRGILPAFFIKEKGVNRWVPLQELSSGMQKVLLIVTDILTLPRGSIYLIDEYENSLGVNAIDFLPQFIVDHGENIQFFITTHHPYLINSMPMKNWRVFRRVGSKVSIKPGSEFEEKYGKSKQRAFTQLINDPFYLGEGQ